MARRTTRASAPNFNQRATQYLRNRSPATGGAGVRSSGVRLDSNRNFIRNGSVYHRALNGEDYAIPNASLPSLDRTSVNRASSDGS